MVRAEIIKPPGHTPNVADHDVGPFRLANRWDQLKTAVAATALIRGGAPLLTSLASRDSPILSRSIRSWATVTSKVLGLDVRESGLDLVESDQPYVVTALHEGMADPLLLSRLPLQLRYLVRDELFDWQYLGQFLRASSQIEVATESARRDSVRITRQSRRAVDSGESLVVFPQGSVLGIEIAFTKGAFVLADRLEVPVLPVVITGTHRVWEHPFNPALRYGQTVAMTILEPLPVGTAVSSMTEIEAAMKELAMANQEAPARHFDPERDGFWDGYDYEIDPRFPELAEVIAAHRATARGRPTAGPTVTPATGDADGRGA